MADASQRQPDANTPPPAIAEDEQLAGWKERIADLPDVRMAKVMRLRRAIAADSYDEEMALNKMLDTIQNDLGVLCRTKFDEDQ